MSEAPTVGKIDRSTEKIIQVKKDNTSRFFYLKIKENILTISTEIKDSLISHFYDTIVSMQEIQKNKYFLQFDTIEEIFEELNLKSKLNPPEIIKENDNFVIKISLFSSKFKDIEFTLKQRKKNNEDKFEELYTLIFDINLKVLKFENSD
jgi:hypothetical protein